MRFRRISAWLLALVLAGCLCFGGLLAAVLTGARDEVKGDPQLMVILGCQVKPWGPSILLQDRLDTALAYLEEHPDVPVILSGGQGPGEAITEAECMRRALVRRGVDESRLYPEERSTSTQENLRYSRAILEELGVDPARRVAIVTSDFHLCRARLMWGGDTAAVPAHLPSALYFQCLTVNYFIREAFGLAAYFVYGG